MDKESIRAALKAEILAERRRKRCRRTWHSLIAVTVILSAAAFAIPYVSAKYTDYNNSLLEPAGLDSITDTDLAEALYPPGSVYISTDGTDHNSLFPGVWVSYAQGLCLISEGTGYAIGSTGGTAEPATRSSASALTGTVTNVGGTISAITGNASGVGASKAIAANISGVSGGSFAFSGTLTLAAANLPSHTHTGVTHTHSVPSHSHTFLYRSAANGNPEAGNDKDSAVNDLRNYWVGYGTHLVDITRSTAGVVSTVSGNTNSGASSVTNTGNSTGTGAGYAVSGTASASGLSGSSNLTSAAAGYSGSISVSGSASGLSGTVSGSVTNAADKTMQPYIVVCMWRRTS